MSRAMFELECLINDAKWMSPEQAKRCFNDWKKRFIEKSSVEISVSARYSDEAHKEFEIKRAFKELGSIIAERANIWMDWEVNEKTGVQRSTASLIYFKANP